MSDDAEFTAHVRNFALQFATTRPSVHTVSVSTSEIDTELYNFSQTEVFMSDYIINKSQNDIYSTDEITQTRLYPFKVPTTYNTTVSTWLSYLYDLFSSKVSINKGIIFVHNGYVKSLFDNVSTDYEFDIKQHHVYVNSSLTRMVVTHDDLTVTVRNWDVIGNIGSALFPHLCKGRLDIKG